MKTYILSNNHVLANSNNTNPFEPIYQPGPLDGGNGQDEIAKVISWVQLLSGSLNYVDAALARPNALSTVSANILGIGRVQGARKAVLGMRVQKSGRTTGRTQGVVTILRAYIQVNYGNSGMLTFDDQIIIQPVLQHDIFSQGGDSGSLILDDNRGAVGLLFAGSESFTLANPIERVLASLHIGYIL